MNLNSLGVEYHKFNPGTDFINIQYVQRLWLGTRQVAS